LSVGGPATRFHIALPLLGAALAACLLAQPARAGEPNDLREFRLGMRVEDLPRSGYTDFSCAAAPHRRLSSWQEYRECPADAAGRHEVRFRYDNSTDPLAHVSDTHEGTRVAGHPVLVSLLIGDDGRLDGIRIETDPKARLFMHKKAFLLALQAKARFGEEGWTCTEGQPTADEQPIGGVFFKEHCEKATPTRHIIVERDLFRHPGQELKDFVGDTKVTILPAS
jgi:hypothetical protein